MVRVKFRPKLHPPLWFIASFGEIRMRTAVRISFSNLPEAALESLEVGAHALVGRELGEKRKIPRYAPRYCMR